MAAVIPFVKAAVVAVKAWAATTAFTVVGTAVTYGALVKTALVVGTYAYQRKQAKKALGAMSSIMASEVRTQNVRTSTGPALIVVGKVRVGGYVPFTTQSGTNKEYTHLIIVHSWLECDSMAKYYLNGEEITLDGSGNVTAPAKWAGLVRVKTHMGSPTQTVDTDLQTDVGSSLWSNDHRLRGWCYSYVRYKTDAEVFSEGLPVYTVDLKGVKWYDPRTATTVWTANPSPIIRGWLLLTKDMGGYGAPASSIVDARWNAVANSCDEAVSLAAGGTENRYELNGIIDTSVARGQILDKLCGGMAGSCPWFNGAFYPIAGVYGSVEMDITDDDVVGAVEVETRDSSADAFNGVRGIYTGEKNQWQGGDFPEVSNSTYATEDGEVMWKDVVLDFTTSPSMCQRIVKIMLEESRQDFSEVLPCKLKALRLVPGSIVTRTTAAMGWTAKPFRVKAVGITQTTDAKGNPLIVPGLAIRETAAGVFDWNNGEETTVDLAPNSTLTDGNSVPDVSGFAAVTAPSAEQTALPRVKLTWTAPANVLVTNGGKTEIEYKKASESTWTPWNRVRGDVLIEYVSDLEIGVSYDFRARHENSLGKHSANWVTDNDTAPNGQATYSGVLGSAGGGGSVASGTYASLSPALTLTVTSDGKPRLVGFASSYIANASGGSQTCYAAIYRGATLIAELADGNGLVLASGESVGADFSGVDTPSAGSVTYELKVKGSAAASVAAGGQLVAH
jgi:hypothetical protein